MPEIPYDSFADSFEEPDGSEPAFETRAEPTPINLQKDLVGEVAESTPLSEVLDSDAQDNDETDPTSGESAIECAAAFCLEYKDVQPDQEGSVLDSTAEVFTATMSKLIHNGQEASSEPRNSTLLGQLDVYTKIRFDQGENPTEDNLPAARVCAEIELNSRLPYDQAEGGMEVPLVIRYALQQTDGGFEKTVTTNAGQTTSQPTDREVQDFTSMFKRLCLASRADTATRPEEPVAEEKFHVLIQAPIHLETENVYPSREIPDTAVNKLLKFTPQLAYEQSAGDIGYTYEDLERFITGHPAILKDTPIVDTFDLDKPGYMISGINSSGAFMNDDPVTDTMFAQHLAGVEEEYAKLAAFGAAIPPHTHFLVTDADTKTQMAFIVRRTLDNHKTLYVGDTFVTPDTQAAQERITGILYNYLTNAINDAAVLEDIVHPKCWSLEGELRYLTQSIAPDLDQVRSGFANLDFWLSTLEPTPNVCDLLDKTRERLNWLDRITGLSD